MRGELLREDLLRGDGDGRDPQEEHGDHGDKEDPVRAHEARTAALHRGAKGLLAEPRRPGAGGDVGQAAVPPRGKDSRERVREEQQQQGGEEDQGVGPAGYRRGHLPERPVQNCDRRGGDSGRVPDQSWLQPDQGPLPETGAGEQQASKGHRVGRPAEERGGRVGIQHSAPLAGYTRILRHRGLVRRQGEAVPGRAERGIVRRAAVHPDAPETRRSDQGGERRAGEREGGGKADRQLERSLATI